MHPPGQWDTDATVAALYTRHQAALLRRAMRLLGDPQEALDVLQDVFETLLLNAPQLRLRSARVRWLHGTTTFLCMNRRRALARRAALLARQGGPWLDGQEAPQGELRVRAQEVLDRLPEELQPIAVSYFVGEKTQDEIAVDVGCSRRTIGYQLERIRRLLR